MSKEKEQTRFINEEDCDFGFQNCLENKDFENISDYYESIKQILKAEVKHIKKENEHLNKQKNTAWEHYYKLRKKFKVRQKQ